MFRLLQILAVFLLIRVFWQAIRRVLGGAEQPRFGERGGGPGEPIYRGHMVRDPVCGVYVPRESAVVDRVSGEVRYFCSENCRETFRTGGATAK